MSKPLANRVAREYTVGGGAHLAQTSRGGRGVQPSFIDSIEQVGSVDSILVSIATPALSAGQSATVNGSKGLTDASSVSLASFDTGRIIFVPTSVIAPSGLLPGHPTCTVTSAQGNPVIGQLASGQSYSGIGVSVSVTVYALTAASSGTLTLEGHALLLGGVLGD